MAYTLVIPNRVRKQIRGLTPYAFERIKEAMLALADNPRPGGCRKLRGTQNEYRIKVGKHYRVQYHIDDDNDIVGLSFVGLRRDAYGDL